MTAFLRSYITKDHVSSEFIDLLDNYGSWCRYTGCASYYSLYKKSLNYVIDDESALILDRCFQELKSESELSFLLMMLHHRVKLDALDIHVLISHKNRYKNLHLSHEDIQEILNVSTESIFSKLKERLC